MPAVPPQSGAGTPIPGAETGASPGIAIPPWTKIQIANNEEAIAFSELKRSFFGIVALIALPAILCIPLPLVLDKFIAAAVAGLIAVITFVIAFIIAKGNGRSAVILTSQRAVCVLGKKIIEARK